MPADLGLQLHVGVQSGLELGLPAPGAVGDYDGIGLDVLLDRLLQRKRGETGQLFLHRRMRFLRRDRDPRLVEEGA
jgi:hypothetical protein